MHVMIDTETLGVSSRSAILQLSAVPFSLEAPTYALEENLVFDRHVKLDGQHRLIDGGTIMWWLQQSDEARQRIVSGQKIARELHDVLQDLCYWFRYCVCQQGNRELTGVWAHGATFDIALLHDAFEHCGLTPPWGYRLPRDTRSVFALVGGAPDVPRVGVLHDAVSDAVTQARQVQVAIELLRSGGKMTAAL